MPKSGYLSSCIERDVEQVVDRQMREVHPTPFTGFASRVAFSYLCNDASQMPMKPGGKSRTRGGRSGSCAPWARPRGRSCAHFPDHGSSIGVIGTLTGTLLSVIFCWRIDEIRRFVAYLTKTPVFDPNVYYLTQLPADDALRATIEDGLGTSQRIKVLVRLSRDSWRTREQLEHWPLSANLRLEHVQQVRGAKE